MLLRNFLLRAAANPFLVRYFASLGRYSGLFRRFVAGETIEETIAVVRELNRGGILATLDQLGEGVTQESEAARATDGYINLLKQIHSSGIQSTISIKLTQLGLEVDRELAWLHLRRILETASELNNFVRIDMEGSAHTQATLDLFRQAWDGFGRERVGIVIQAYLYRSEQDVRELSALGCNIRLCKGAYMEPPEVAFPRKSDVDRNFRRLVDIMLASPGYSAIATHDDAMIRHALGTVRKLGVGLDRYEFQMLYGIRRERQWELARQGYRMRIYVPFGTQWAPYYMRRLAERPANLLFILKSLFRR
ncbi:MAG: proline dehydrogenase [Acidobacteriota bacterium]